MRTFRIIFMAVISMLMAACAGQKLKPSSVEAPQNAGHEVSGTISLTFIPTALADTPQPPISMYIFVKEENSDEAAIHKMENHDALWSLYKDRDAIATDNFTFNLKPGNYQISGVEIYSKSLGDRPFEFPFTGPVFTVSENAACTYLGRVGLMFMRLPPGTREQAMRVVRMMANRSNRPFAMVYLPLGALVPFGYSIDTPKEDEKIDSKNIGYSNYKKSIDNNCEIKLFQLPNKK